MARIKINIPDHFPFQTVIPTRITDLNYGGHIGNDAILSIMQEARAQFIQHLGFKNEVSIEGEIGTIVADAAIVYKSEGFYGDHFVVSIATDDFNKYGFDIYYQITNEQDKREIAIGKTGIVCFDYDRKKLALIPPKFLEVLRQAK